MHQALCSTDIMGPKLLKLMMPTGIDMCRNIVFVEALVLAMMTLGFISLSDCTAEFLARASSDTGNDKIGLPIPIFQGWTCQHLLCSVQ